MARWGVVFWCVVAASFVVASGVVGRQTGAVGSHVENYSGMMVCADCSGIKTTLVLERDDHGAPGAYTMSETYMGRSAAGTRKTSGMWTIVRGDAADKNAVVYQLHQAGSLSVTSFVKGNENELRMLDGNLAELPASVPHTLKRVAAVGGVKVVSEQTKGEVDLQMGEGLEVRLEANHTTGYSWVAAPVANPVLVMQGKAAYQENAAGGKAGVGGVEVWRFKAVKAGKEGLQFDYRRPWEKNVPAAKAVAFSIRVE
jgi:predicted secreted protein